MPPERGGVIHSVIPSRLDGNQQTYPQVIAQLASSGGREQPLTICTVHAACGPRAGQTGSSFVALRRLTDGPRRLINLHWVTRLVISSCMHRCARFHVKHRQQLADSQSVIPVTPGQERRERGTGGAWRRIWLNVYIHKVIHSDIHRFGCADHLGKIKVRRGDSGAGRTAEAC